MKVIAKINSNRFLCEVSDYELRKFMNKFNDFGMDVGREIDLTRGYDFAKDAIEAMKKTNDFISSNKDVIDTIFQGIKIVSINSEKDDEQ